MSFQLFFGKSLQLHLCFADGIFQPHKAFTGFVYQENMAQFESDNSSVAGQFEQAENSKLKFNKFEEKKKFQSESKK